MAACFWASPSWPASYSAKYDAEIQSAVKRWIPAYPTWLRAKAQLIQESGLRPDVCSAVGACGLGQFMPGTWSDVGKALGGSTAADLRFNPSLSIERYAYYQGRLYNQWRANRPTEDRVSLAEASYNAGIGWILKAQQLCNNAALWADVMRCLPQVTGHNAEETINYSIRIRSILKRLQME